MIKKILLVFTVIFQVYISNAQDIVYTRDKYPEMRYLGLSGTVYFNTYNQIKGSAFLFDTWSKGNIFLKNGVVLKDINFKIDLFAQQVLIYHEILKRIIIIDKSNLEGLTFVNNDVERKFKKLDGLKTRSLANDGIIVEALTEGPISFYKVFYKNKIALSDPVKPFIDEFSDELEYYILKDSIYFSVRPGKHNLIKLFPEYKTEIKQHVRQFHLRLRKESDFSKALSYLNELKK
jgi:hypothetical protein